jgi:hypothetical protein
MTIFQQAQAPAATQVQNGALPGHACVTPEARLSYFKCYKPEPDLNKKMMFQCVLLIPKGTDVSAIQNSVNAAIQTGIAKKWRGMQPPNLQLPLKDGDAYAAQKPDKRQAYVGNWYINCKQDPEFGQPVILLESGVRSTNPLDVQSGDYAIAVVEFVPYSNTGEGVTCIPKVIRKTRTGEHFTGGVSESAALAALGGETPPEVAAAGFGAAAPALSSLF